MNKINSNEIESINHSDIKSLEDYLQYKRQQSKKWYQLNREKKIEYQKNRYYNSKNINPDKQ